MEDISEEPKCTTYTFARVKERYLSFHRLFIYQLSVLRSRKIRRKKKEKKQYNKTFLCLNQLTLKLLKKKRMKATFHFGRMYYSLGVREFSRVPSGSGGTKKKKYSIVLLK